MSLRKLLTGIVGLDRITLGGLPEGRATLVAGKSGTAKSILGLQVGANFARQGIPTAIFAVEEVSEDMIESGDALGFGVSELVARGDLRLIDLSSTGDTPIVTGEFDLGAMVQRIDALAQAGVRALVLDSVTALLSPRPPPERLRGLFFQLVHSLRQHRMTAVLLAEAAEDYGPRTTLGVEDFVCDAVLVLRNLNDEERRRRTVEVYKYRRSAHQKGEYPFTITNTGMVVFPFDSEPHLRPTDQSRFPSGVEGLDRMMNGGWLRDSITIARGPAGSGKTTLAGMYARAGAARGERVAYYGFEETRSMLLRNFASVGLPLEEFTESGNLLLECRYPESTSPEDLLVELRRSLEEFKPSLIVIDSISSVGHSTSKRGFRQFMVGFASMVREHSRSALLTQTLSTTLDEDHGAPFLSTIADAIIVTDYHPHAQKLIRTIRVIKMRGSDHSDDAFHLSIGEGGLCIEELRLDQI